MERIRGMLGGMALLCFGCAANDRPVPSIPLESSGHEILLMEDLSIELASGVWVEPMPRRDSRWRAVCRTPAGMVFEPVNTEFSLYSADLSGAASRTHAAGLVIERGRCVGVHLFGVDLQFELPRALPVILDEKR